MRDNQEIKVGLTDGDDSKELNDSVEWKNGDECVFTDRCGVEIDCKVVGLLPTFVESYVLHCAERTPALFVSNISRMKKPETPEQRKEREEMEAAYDLYCTHVEVVGAKAERFDYFKLSTLLCDGYLAIVRKTGYRK